MANKTISDLRELSTVSDNNVLVVETNAETFKVTKENLLKEVNEELNTKSNINHTHDEYVTETELNAKGLATESFVGSEISKIELTPGPKGPKGDKGDKGDPGTTTWEGITNKPTNLATESFVTTKIAEASLSGGNVDLSGYATKEELSNKSDKTHNHSYNDLTDKPTIPSTTNLATKTELTNGLATKADKVHTHDQYLTEHQDLSDYALKNEIPTVPTKVSQLTNDKGYLTSVPSEYVTETELNDAISGLGGGTGNVSSDVIRSIMVVDALPEVELEGVLYLVKETTIEPEPTVTNLYPSQTTSTTSNGFTITFAERNVTIDGSKDTGSVLGQTEEFDMNLKANKTYYLQFTNVSGSFDDSKRVSENDGMICNVELKTYDSSHTPIILIDNVERDASGIYDKYTFTPKVDCIKFRLLFQAKKLMSFSNWTCSIVIAEEGV